MFLHMESLYCPSFQRVCRATHNVDNWKNRRMFCTEKIDNWIHTPIHHPITFDKAFRFVVNNWYRWKWITWFILANSWCCLHVCSIFSLYSKRFKKNLRKNYKSKGSIAHIFNELVSTHEWLRGRGIRSIGHLSRELVATHNEVDNWKTCLAWQRFSVRKGGSPISPEGKLSYFVIIHQWIFPLFIKIF